VNHNSLRIEDIEEFNLAGKVPKSAITPEILQGIKLLDEASEMEAYLREIISDRTFTPHNSAETADIMTNLTVNGATLRSAFVNKGKSYPNVTATKVTHQITRLRKIRGLELIILAASGNIQDDVRVDLFQIASDAQAQALIIDATDLARLFIAHHKVCPKDGSPFKKGACIKCGRVASQPIELSMQVFEEPRFRIIGQDGNSGVVKKHSARILTDPHYQRATIREVITMATNQLRKSRIQKPDSMRQESKNRDTDSVRLFLYVDLQDEQAANWICRSLWINPNTPNELRPLPLGGQEFFGEIEIDWKQDYHVMQQFWAERLGDKPGWISKISTLLPEVERLENIAKTLLKKLESGEVTEALFTNEMAKYEPAAMELFLASDNKLWPPIECKAADARFSTMTAHLHNAFLPFTTRTQNTQTWDKKICCTKTALTDFENQRESFSHEWRNLGGSWR
jgi:hypothetical protein